MAGERPGGDAGGHLGGAPRPRRAFARAAYGAGFARGEDIADLDVLAACAGEAGLDAGELPQAVRRPEIKEALRAATAAAWEAGMRGVPTLIAGGVVYYGDDQLERAAGPEGARSGSGA